MYTLRLTAKENPFTMFARVRSRLRQNSPVSAPPAELVSILNAWQPPVLRYTNLYFYNIAHGDEKTFDRHTYKSLQLCRHIESLLTERCSRRSFPKYKWKVKTYRNPIHFHDLVFSFLSFPVDYFRNVYQYISSHWMFLKISLHMKLNRQCKIINLNLFYSSIPCRLCTLC